MDYQSRRFLESCIEKATVSLESEVVPEIRDFYRLTILICDTYLGNSIPESLYSGSETLRTIYERLKFSTIGEDYDLGVD